MKKHILILGGFYKLHQILNELNCDITFVTTINKMRDYSKNSIYKRIVILPKQASNKEWLLTIDNINKIQKIDRIVTFQDYLQDKAAFLAEKLNLKYNNSLSTINIISNKYKIRKILKEKNIENIPFKLIENLQETIDFINKECSYPCIIKPINLSGSSFIFKVDNQISLIETINKCKRINGNIKFFIEKYIEGEEFSVESISEKGIHKIYCITKKYKDNSNFVEIGHTVNVKNNLDKIVVEKIENKVKKILDTIGIQEGPCHTEVIVNGTEVNLVETHTRLGGDYIPELFEISSGVDILKLIAKQTLGENVLYELEKNNTNNDSYATVLYKYSAQNGKIKKINFDFEKNQDIKLMDIFYNEGEVVRKLSNSRDRILCVISSGISEKESFNKTNEILKKIKVEIGD